MSWLLLFCPMHAILGGSIQHAKRPFSEGLSRKKLSPSPALRKNAKTPLQATRIKAFAVLSASTS
ncbi:hypothetical protein MBA34_22585 [Pseudomonas capeferrum]|uniref:hypothetical protein n=1 Tax=Pseudomonas capeferrum TaxID=1495066 RepID=UPI0012DE5940|nr:hypothetical protein [Pseudomonas capeferrum]MCH7301801.1 hypothetical protein [Pseudomonas capeferrum]